jgi:hypothetical protein
VPPDRYTTKQSAARVAIWASISSTVSLSSLNSLHIANKMVDMVEFDYDTGLPAPKPQDLFEKVDIDDAVAECE